MLEPAILIVTTDGNPHQTQEIMHRAVYEQLKDEQSSGATDYTHRILGIHPESYKITALRITEPSLNKIAYLDVPPTVLEDRMAVRLRPRILVIYKLEDCYPESQLEAIDHLLTLAATGHNIIIGITSETLIETIQKTSNSQNITTKTL